MRIEKTCDNCKYLFKDHSTNYQECMNFSGMTSKEIDVHFTDNLPGCKYYIPSHEWLVGEWTEKGVTP